MSIEKHAYLAAQECLRQRYGKKIIFALSSDNLRRCDAAYDMIYFDKKENLMTKVCDVRYDHLIITVGEDGKVCLMKEPHDVIPPTSKESSLMTMTDKLALIFAKIMKATNIDDAHELAQKGVDLCSHLASEEIEKGL